MPQDTPRFPAFYPFSVGTVHAEAAVMAQAIETREGSGTSATTTALEVPANRGRKTGADQDTHRAPKW